MSKIKTIGVFCILLSFFLVLIPTQVSSAPLDLVDSIDVGAQGDTNIKCVTVDDNYLWITEQDDDAINCYGLSNETKIPSKQVDLSAYTVHTGDETTSKDPRGVTDYEDYLYVVWKNSNNMEVFSKTTGDHVRSETLHVDNDYPQGITTDGNYFWVTDYNNCCYPNEDNVFGNVYIYTYYPFAFVEMINVSTTIGSDADFVYGIAVDDTSGTLLLTDYSADLIYRINKYTFAEISNQSMNHAGSQADRGLDIHGDLVYLADPGADKIFILEGYDGDTSVVGNTDVESEWTFVAWSSHERMRGENITMPATGGTLSTVSAYLKYTTTTSYAKAAIYNSASDFIAESSAVNIVSSSGAWYDFEFTGDIDLNATESYFFMIYADYTGSGSISIAYDSTTGLYYYEDADNYPVFPDPATLSSYQGLYSLYVTYGTSAASGGPDYTMTCSKVGHTLIGTDVNLQGLFTHTGTTADIAFSATAVLTRLGEGGGAVSGITAKINQSGYLSWNVGDLVRGATYQYQFTYTRINLTDSSFVVESSSTGEFYVEAFAGEDFEWRDEWTVLFCLGVTIFMFLLPSLISAQARINVPPIINVFSGFMGIIALVYFAVLPITIIYLLALAMIIYIVYIFRRM